MPAELGDNPFMKIWKGTVLGAFFWWLLGLNLFFYHLVAGLLFLGILFVAAKNPKGLFLPSSFFFLLLLSAIYAFSILIHASASDFSRVLAAFYNLSFWLMGLMLVVILANTFTFSQIPSLLKVFYSVAWFSGLLALAVMGIWFSGTRSFIFPTPLYGLTNWLGHTTLVETTLMVRLLLVDWFASFTRPRFNLFSPYPTAAGGILMILLTMLLVRFFIDKKINKPLFIFLFLSNLLGLVMTLSRISLLALALSLAWVFFIQRKHFPLWIFLSLGVLVLALPALEKFTQYFLELREGSTLTRWDLYQYSLDQLEGVDWILGLGVKPRGQAFEFPLGSHSTYLSLLFKTGVTGLVTLGTFHASLFFRWYRLKSLLREDRQMFYLWQGLGMIFFAMAIWMLTEDIDAPQLLAFLYFSFVGIFEGLRRNLLDGKTLSPSVA